MPPYLTDNLRQFTNSLLSPLYRDVDAATLKSIDRVVKIWEERSIYDKASIKGLREALGASVAVKSDGVKENNSNNTNASKESSKPARKRDGDDADNGRPSKKHHLDTLDTSSFHNSSSKLAGLDSGSGDLPPVDMSKYEKVDPDKLVKCLKEMENAPSRDTTVQEKLSRLPPEVFDVKLIDSALSSQETADKVAKMVEEAASLLSSYNGRLAKELEDRKNLATMLAYFIESQKRAQTATETTLSEVKEKLRKVTSVQQEFQSHLQNLPDLSQLPSVTPLPSATDLFKL